MTSLTTYVPLLMQGALMTIVTAIISGTMSVTLGTVLGIASCRYGDAPLLAMLVRIYTFIAKGIPAYVQILIAYFVIPAACGISISGFVAGCGALAFCSSGYVTEIVRAGINAVSPGQWDACMVLGYTRYAAFVRIVLPQAYAAMLPALIGEGEQLLKSTSLLATIGMNELTRAGMNIISRELNPLPVYGLIALLYLFFSLCLSLLVRFVIARRINGNR
ncbi:MAG: amino acid ABC transporter permease [Candidatus Babeliales bacterium]